MTLLALMRHGPTAWNAEKRLQGRADTPLGTAGRAAVARWRLPPELAGFTWRTSPLRRCRETAEILCGGPVAVEPRLVEMAWGDWEGQRLEELRRELGAAMTANEAQGLDFRPPAGESPRIVQARLRPFLAEVAACGWPTVAVTHRGVIRAVLALATGWDMIGRPPARLEAQAAHLFRLAPDGAPAVERLNLNLTPMEQAV